MNQFTRRAIPGASLPASAVIPVKDFSEALQRRPVI
jgi:hypothetical protein